MQYQRHEIRAIRAPGWREGWREMSGRAVPAVLFLNARRFGLSRGALRWAAAGVMLGGSSSCDTIPNTWNGVQVYIALLLLLTQEDR